MELVLIRERVCLCGGEMLDLPEVTHVPLFRGVGAGEAVIVRASICLSCWTVRELSRDSTNPRLYDG